jgi:hypothetical protein
MKKKWLIVFYVIHYFFAGGFVSGVIGYNYSENGIDVLRNFALSIYLPVLIAAIFYPFIGMLFDWIIKSKANQTIES